MPLQATSGAASYDAFGGGVPVAPKYIEDYFSTFLYEGNSSVGPVISNGIDLSTKGGLVWLKTRSAATGHVLFDSARGMSGSVDKFLQTQNTDAEIGSTNYINPSTNGFSLVPGVGGMSANAVSYVSWAWAKAPKFFDVVTWTGDGSSPRTISHNLGSVPGCIIVKKYSTSGQDWFVHHRALSADFYGYLNATSAFGNTFSSSIFNGTAPTSTVFTIGSTLNQSGETYVAYLFAHNAGGFGLTGTDNVISCGSLVASGGANDINLGFETQFVLLKKSSAADDWYIYDTMRGMPVGNSGAPALEPNLSAAEANQLSVWPTATGFATNGLSGTYIYIAIRRGPMKTPTTGTNVFSPNLSSSGTGTQITTGFPVDAQISNVTSGGNHAIYDRLRGVTSTTTQSAQYLVTNLTDAELTTTNQVRAWNNTGFQLASGLSGIPVAYWNFRRAPGFMDVCCYTGTGTSGTAIPHNLGVAPELVISKARSTTNNWLVWATALGDQTSGLLLNTADATQTVWASGSSPTSSNVYINYNVAGNSGQTYVAYLFATCPGVSKVGSYTGNGSSQTINCGFTGGARFVLIKATSTTGDWLVWDTARGINPGDDPRLALNSTAAEVSDTDSVDATSSGFIVNNDGNFTNANGVTYIFLAIA